MQVAVAAMACRGVEAVRVRGVAAVMARRGVEVVEGQVGGRGDGS